MLVKIKKLSPQAKEPVYGSGGAACFDLHYAGVTNAYVTPGNVSKVPTGLAFEVPKDHVMLLFSRSGHGVKGVRLGNCVGVIDCDYRGEVAALMTNDSREVMTVAPGDRIAQAMILPVQQCMFLEVDELTDTERGEGGFGSTGK